MQTAINYARHGVGLTGPNPSVGCVVVKNNFLISAARTDNGGRPHAETIALNLAGKNAEGATLYVTLEPCSHQGKTPPCIEKILSNSIKRVVVGCLDPDKRNSGLGINGLKQKGIEVSIGCLQNEAEKLILGFNSRIKNKKPFIVVKIASSIDGKISLLNGRSKWITNKHTRRYIHHLRLRNDAILTGIGTVLKDNPLLNCRVMGMEKFSPKIFVLDSNLKIVSNLKLFKNFKNLSLITTNSFDKNNANKLNNKNVKFEVLDKDSNNQVNLLNLVKYLAQQEINNLLIEAGPKVITNFLNAGLVDRIVLCRAGKLFGSDAIPFIENQNLQKIEHSKNFVLKESFIIKEDVIEFWDIKQ